jgi:N-acetylmuramoyl-L-alanine amidase
MSTPDSSCASAFTASPNHEPRVGSDIAIIVLHYTGMASGRDALDWLCNPASKVSCHYVVNEDGGIIQLVPESRRAYHAGVSSWRGETDINSRSIGIEIVNGGHDFGLPDFQRSQIESVIALCKDIQSRWPIPQCNVLAHSDIAPARKQDPGEKFPWQTLYDAGVGLWVAPEPITQSDVITIGDAGEAVSKLKAMFSNYGYGLDGNDVFDDAMRNVVMAFQRHFRPQIVDGVADMSTTKTLARLLARLLDLQAETAR